MSTAQQPRRVGGVKPRRNTAQEGANHYDSPEVPVLIRLPACSCQAVEEDVTSRSSVRGNEPAAGKSERSRRESNPARGRGPANQADRGIDTRLIVGGLLVGVVVAGLLFLTNGGSTDQSDDVAWPEADGDALVVTEPQISIPQDAETSPTFAYGLETVDGLEAQPTPRELIDPSQAPNLADVPNPGETAHDATSDGSTANTATTSWNEEPSTRLYPSGGANSATKRVSNWPSGNFTNTASGTDDRSSMNGSDSGVYRTGRLEQNAPPSGSILDGTIEIPTPTSRR